MSFDTINCLAISLDDLKRMLLREADDPRVYRLTLGYHDMDGFEDLKSTKLLLDPYNVRHYTYTS